MGHTNKGKRNVVSWHDPVVTTSIRPHGFSVLSARSKTHHWRRSRRGNNNQTNTAGALGFLAQERARTND
jgi:hypothetical protein